MIEAERVPQRDTLIGRGWKDTECKSYSPLKQGHHLAVFIEAGRFQSPEGQGQRSQGLGGQR